ncbi:hypothetical protein ABW20_dc0100541 [Dactylellina cionopaga]|nr:hypothetical protein ABW20_dc0100541 [Dactylellina cionopaga]
MIFTKTVMMALLAAAGTVAIPTSDAEPVLPESAYALDPSVPSIPDLVKLLDGDTTSPDARSLERRQWVTDNNFRIYLHYQDAAFQNYNVLKRDNCE